MNTQVTNNIAKINKMLRAETDYKMRKYGLDGGLYQYMAYILVNGNVALKQIVEGTGIDASQVTRAIDKLVNMGYVGGYL